MVRFHAPTFRDGKWRVTIFLRRANGQPAQFAQWFRTRGEAWRFIEQSCDECGEVVAR